MLKSTFATFRSIFQARSAASKALQLALLVHDRCVLFAAYLQVDFTARTYKLPCTHALESFWVRLLCQAGEHTRGVGHGAVDLPFLDGLTAHLAYVWLPSHPSPEGLQTLRTVC